MIKLMYTPVNFSFTIQKLGLRGSKLYKRVFVISLRQASAMSVCLDTTFTNYSGTSMARTSLGPWKFVRNMGSSSH